MIGDPIVLRSPTSAGAAIRGLRVCILAGTLGLGGAERQLFYLTSALKRTGAEVEILCLTAGEFWQSRLQAIEVPVKFVGASRSRLARLMNIAKAARAFRPNVIQSQHFFTNAYSGLTARLIRARAVGAVRGSGSADMQNCGPRLAKACLHFPHLLAVNSRAAIRAMISLGCPGGKFHYLPNVIDLDRFQPPQAPQDNALVILGVGRLGPEKRFDRFLRILSLVKAAGIQFKAQIAGSGPLRTELERLAMAAGLYPDTVQFCGEVDEIQSLYRQAHMLLLTSDHEGTPNVVIEAMASGLPVVATAVGGVPDLVQSGVTGFLAEPHREKELAEAIVKLLKNHPLRLEMSRRARAFVEARHSLTSLPDQLEDLYRRVLRSERSVVAFKGAEVP